MKEIWKDIKDYEGLYQVSNVGNIKSLNYNKTKQEKNLKFGIDTSGYKVVNLWKNGKGKMRTVHRLVAETFIPNPNNHPIINHKDENKQNNTISNLEWCTCEYNLNYSKNSYNKENLRKRMMNNRNANEKKVICITTGQIFRSMAEAGRKYGVDRSSISACCRGKQNHAGNLNGKKLAWIYLE